ncbi:shikimate kinase [Flavobacteriaceae bacterium MHTCC 0001]
MIIVLIGYMGSGKSSVGKILAKKLNYNLIDLDDFIEEREQATVKDIFKTKGEIYFRKKETVYLKELLKLKEDTVLALGGGTPCFAGNMEAILNTDNVISVYLKGSLPFLSKKLFKKKEKRPLIAHIETESLMAEFIGKHLFERSQFYGKAQHHIITDDKAKSEIADDIISTLF